MRQERDWKQKHQKSRKPWETRIEQESDCAMHGHVRLRSLLRVEERLLEGEYFVRQLARRRDSTSFGYELNAFLSAARSVTFLLQKELSKVDGFPDWWKTEQTALGSDEAARFFLELRNYSQKEGRISMVGTAVSSRGKGRRWTYRFAGTTGPVPDSLYNRDVVDCCREHLAKIARSILRCTEIFPYHCCPRRALTPEGVEALQLDLDAIDAMLGYPRGSSEIDGFESKDRIRFLSKQMDGLDFDVIRRISKLKARSPFQLTLDPFGDRLATSLVEQIERRRHGDNTENPVRSVIATEALKMISGRDRPT